MRKNNDPLASATDHDILITLVAQVSSNHAALLEKVANLQSDMMDIKSGSNATLTEHEVRLRALEQASAELNLPAIVDTVQRDHSFLNDFRARWKQTIALTAALGAFLTFLAANIPFWFKLVMH